MCFSASLQLQAGNQPHPLKNGRKPLQARGIGCQNRDRNVPEGNSRSANVARYE